ncbi:hypothetical protein CEQ90_13500 [Lewinellaceae bacterium SD302]|nr:hypothetical protein CEQ90_13500 [Lewinellaceae bacterium SD302]
MPKVQTILFFLIIFQLNCANGKSTTETTNEQSMPQDSTPNSELIEETPPIEVGAERLDTYLPKLENKRVGLVVNQSSRLYGTQGPHLVDTLLAAGVQVTKIFALEHGFRGEADAGATITDGVDDKSGLPIVSLYGQSKEPGAADLADVDLIVFDIQDVGVRFFTYISHLHYILQGAAKHDTPVMILDRPNPNGHYIDGPILDPAFQSFVGMHPVPVVHGMTIGEYGQMINGRGWLDDGLRAELTVIPCANYSHGRRYALPIKPSPNLPNERSILLYPSLCFFEGTIVSIGRGTDQQFQIYGHPLLSMGSYIFTPKPGPGSTDPKLNGKSCVGFSLVGQSPELIRSQGRINLNHLLRAYAQLKDHAFFDRPDFFDLLAGSSQLRQQIESGMSEKDIRAGWAEGLVDFLQAREPYLLYP